jgi:hypothetical protein
MLPKREFSGNFVNAKYAFHEVMQSLGGERRKITPPMNIHALLY